MSAILGPPPWSFLKLEDDAQPSSAPTPVGQLPVRSGDAWDLAVSIFGEPLPVLASALCEVCVRWWRQYVSRGEGRQ